MLGRIVLQEHRGKPLALIWEVAYADLLERRVRVSAQRRLSAEGCDALCVTTDKGLPRGLLASLANLSALVSAVLILKSR